MKATRFSELELREERFDRKPGPIRAKVFICAAPRTGSWLLCRGMIHNGIGVPHEYFNALHAGPIGRRWGIPGFNDGRNLVSDSKPRRSYIDALLQRRTVNGAFAAKMHWDQYADYLDNPEGDDLLQNAHFIHLIAKTCCPSGILPYFKGDGPVGIGRLGHDASSGEAEFLRCRHDRQSNEEPR
jgi:hypothetical protein